MNIVQEVNSEFIRIDFPSVTIPACDLNELNDLITDVESRIRNYVRQKFSEDEVYTSDSLLVDKNLEYYLIRHSNLNDALKGLNVTFKHLDDKPIIVLDDKEEFVGYSEITEYFWSLKTNAENQSVEVLHTEDSDHKESEDE